MSRVDVSVFVVALSVTLLMLVSPVGWALLGDVDSDGNADIIDALQVARHDAGMSVDIDLSAADVDCDGGANIIDALTIARYDAGLISGFCV